MDRQCLLVISMVEHVEGEGNRYVSAESIKRLKTEEQIRNVEDDRMVRRVRRVRKQGHSENIEKVSEQEANLIQSVYTFNQQI